MLYVDSSGTDDHSMGYHVGKLPTLISSIQEQRKLTLLPDEESKAKPGLQKKSHKIISSWLIYHQLTVLGGGGIVTTCFSEASLLCLHNLHKKRIVSLRENQPTFMCLGRYNIEDLYCTLLDPLCSKINELIFRAVR